jgi:A/G-specific adenine glycosylase
MADLYEFPYFDCSAEGMDAQRCLEDVGKAFGLSAKVVRALDEVSHSFTRYQAKLFPWLLITNERKPIEGLQWVPEKSVHDFAFSSGHLRILNQLTDCR